MMAHALLVDEAGKRFLSIDVYSAGVIDFSDQPLVEQTSKTCLHYNTPSPKASPSFVGQLPIDTIKRFLVMEKGHAAALANEFGISPDRISLLGTFDPRKRGDEIDDPFYSYSDVVYRRSYERIRDCIIGYLDTTEDFG
jgi:protein-tyrosine-phosphatase